LQAQVEPTAIENVPAPAVSGTLPRTQWKSSAKPAVRVAAGDCPCLPDPVVSEAPFAVLVPVLGGLGVVATVVVVRRRANRVLAAKTSA
jgi:hypothetical protein